MKTALHFLTIAASAWTIANYDPHQHLFRVGLAMLFLWSSLVALAFRWNECVDKLMSEP